MPLPSRLGAATPPSAAVCRAAHRVALGHLEDPAVDLALTAVRTAAAVVAVALAIAVIFVGTGSAAAAVVVNIVAASTLAFFPRCRPGPAAPSAPPGPAAPRPPGMPCLSCPACTPASRATPSLSSYPPASRLRPGRTRRV